MISKKVSFQQILSNQIHIPGLLLTKYQSMGLDEKEVMLVLQLIRFLEEYNDFPTPFDIAAVMTMDEKECANLLRKLVQKNVISIEQKENERKQLSEAYSLEPLWEMLFDGAEKEKPKQEEEIADGSIFLLFEQEFGRPLSPFEIETISVWLDDDKIAPALIKAGLRESVLMGKLNFKYIDRILLEWKKKGIHSVEQARNASRGFHANKSGNPGEKSQKRDTSFYYNWLEGED